MIELFLRHRNDQQPTLQGFVKQILLHPHTHMNLYHIIGCLFTCWYVDAKLLYYVCMYVCTCRKMNTWKKKVSQIFFFALYRGNNSFTSIHSENIRRLKEVSRLIVENICNVSESPRKELIYECCKVCHNFKLMLKDTTGHKSH